MRRNPLDREKRTPPVQPATGGAAASFGDEGV